MLRWLPLALLIVIAPAIIGTMIINTGWTAQTQQATIWTIAILAVVGLAAFRKAKRN